MTTDCQTYLDCFGLNRLVLCALASLLRERESEDGLEREDVSKRCLIEVEKRAEPEFTSEAFQAAWDTAVGLKWVEESSGSIRLSDLGWRVYGHDFNHVSLAPSPSSVALSADDSCQLILGTLTETKKNKRYRYDPRINRLGEITIRELRTWIAMRGASEEQFALPFCALLARNRVRVVPTCPDADLSLLSATSAGLRGKISSLQPDPHLVESVILRHLESAEEDAYQRAYRIPDVASRELATTLLEANNGPQHGVTLADLTSFIERVFPQITIEPRRTPKKADFFEIPAQVLDAISRVTSVESDHSKPCVVREYFGLEHFPAIGNFGGCLVELLQRNRVHVADFRAVSDESSGPFGPILRVGPYDPKRPAAGSQAGAGGKTKKRRPGRAPKLTEKQLRALEIYERDKTYTAVAEELKISRQAVTELVKKAQIARQAILDATNKAGRAGGTSARANWKLPEDHRGQVNIEGSR